MYVCICKYMLLRLGSHFISRNTTIDFSYFINCFLVEEKH